MRKISKLLLLITCLFGMILAFFTLTSTQSSSPIKLNFYSPLDYPIIGFWMPYILFWLSIVMLCAFILTFFVILFWRKKEPSLIFKDEDSTLEITKNAVNGFISCTVEESGFLVHPSIVTKVKKQKIRCSIRGYTTTYSNVEPKAKELEKEIKSKLSQMLNDQKEIAAIRIKVLAKAKKDGSTKHRPRVV